MGTTAMLQGEGLRDLAPAPANSPPLPNVTLTTDIGPVQTTDWHCLRSPAGGLGWAWWGTMLGTMLGTVSRGSPQPLPTGGGCWWHSGCCSPGPGRPPPRCVCPPAASPKCQPQQSGGNPKPSFCSDSRQFPELSRGPFQAPSLRLLCLFGPGLSPGPSTPWEPRAPLPVPSPGVPVRPEPPPRCPRRSRAPAAPPAGLGPGAHGGGVGGGPAEGAPGTLWGFFRVSPPQHSAARQPGASRPRSCWERPGGSRCPALAARIWGFDPNCIPQSISPRCQAVSRGCEGGVYGTQQPSSTPSPCTLGPTLQQPQRVQKRCQKSPFCRE